MYIKDTSSAINIYMKMKCVHVFLNMFKVCLLRSFRRSFLIHFLRSPAGSWYNTPMMHLCLVIISVSGLFAYSSCRHEAGETPAFKSPVHHDHFRICASWRLSWNAFMACCGLLDGDQWRLCRKREIQDGIKCWLQTPAEKLSAVIFPFQNNHCQGEIIYSRSQRENSCSINTFSAL